MWCTRGRGLGTALGAPCAVVALGRAGHAAGERSALDRVVARLVRPIAGGRTTPRGTDHDGRDRCAIERGARRKIVSDAVGVELRARGGDRYPPSARSSMRRVRRRAARSGIAQAGCAGVPLSIYVAPPAPVRSARGGGATSAPAWGGGLRERSRPVGRGATRSERVQAGAHMRVTARGSGRAPRAGRAASDSIRDGSLARWRRSDRGGRRERA